ncbi:MAG: methyltransferase domain-containing protein [Planctomycetota bacterium]|jgi:trans-aconitate 2-methyltransferase
MNVKWDPERYERFEKERSQPFFDLLDGVESVPGGRVLDLGCGTGKLTRHLHERSGARSTLGIDRSKSMLAEAQPGEGLEFRNEDIATFEPPEPFDIVFSNAALQWLGDHDALFAKVASWVAPGGQLAVQMPANQHHVSHVLARQIATEEFGIEGRGTSVRKPDEYSVILHRLGFASPTVRVHVYLHELDGPEAVVEWVAGTMLNAYRARLSEGDFDRFAKRHRDACMEALPGDRPFPFTFPRILMWARKPA